MANGINTRYDDAFRELAEATSAPLAPPPPSAAPSHPAAQPAKLDEVRHDSQPVAPDHVAETKTLKPGPTVTSSVTFTAEKGKVGAVNASPETLNLMVRLSLREAERSAATPLEKNVRNMHVQNLAATVLGDRARDLSPDNRAALRSFIEQNSALFERHPQHFDTQEMLGRLGHQ